MNTGPTRRDLLRMGVLGSVGLASSALLPAWAAAPATAPSAPKGRLKQSVARWLFQQPIDQLCVTVKQVGLSAIDLVGPEEWPVLKAHGIDSPMCNGAEISLKQGFAGTEFHDELVARYTRHIDLVADAGYRNLICFSGNRNGMDPLQGMRNAEVGLKRVLGHAEKRGVVLVMELLNSRVDHADYLCDHSAWAWSCASASARPISACCSTSITCRSWKATSSRASVATMNTSSTTIPPACPDGMSWTTPRSSTTPPSAAPSATPALAATWRTNSAPPIPTRSTRCARPSPCATCERPTIHRGKQSPMADNHYDAIVVGSGISGGWAAKELTERGLKVLMLERGRNIEHIKDYVNAGKEAWTIRIMTRRPSR